MHNNSNEEYIILEYLSCNTLNLSDVLKIDTVWQVVFISGTFSLTFQKEHKCVGVPNCVLIYMVMICY